MHDHTDNIAALIGSRICHDLISPVGAIANGLELLTIAGGTDGPEMQLLQDSARGATAKIRQFRLAFGQANDQQAIGKEEFAELLSDLFGHGRITVTHTQAEAMPRTRAKAVMLAIMCAEQALPFGGQLIVTITPDRCTVTAESPRLAPDPTLWQGLQTATLQSGAGPDHVQFLYLVHHMAALNMQLQSNLTETKATISF